MNRGHVFWTAHGLALGSALTAGAVSTQSGQGAAGLALVFLALVIVLSDVDQLPPAPVVQEDWEGGHPWD